MSFLTPQLHAQIPLNLW